jgi:hypothetical protein
MINETKIDILDELGLSQPIDSSQLVPVESQKHIETKTKQIDTKTKKKLPLVKLLNI